MAIKDKIVKWFIQNIVIPRQEIIDRPGFIVTQFSDKGKSVFLREIFLPESVILILEKQIVSKFGERGKEALYSAGKMFGYSYAARSFFPKITVSTPNEFENFIYMWMKYAESTTYGKIDYVFDKDARTITLNVENFMVCPQNGMGYFTTSGSFAGFWAYLMDDYSVECIQTKCKGRGDEICIGVAGRNESIQKSGKETIISKNKAPSWNEDVARNINAIRPCQFNTNSFKDLLDSGFFRYEQGLIIKGNERHFLIESSALYFLENQLLTIDKSNKILFDLSFNFGKALSDKGGKDYEHTISTYMSALGYGDVYIINKGGKFSVRSDYFPWTPYADKINFAYFRGIISGLLSGFLGKTILLKRIKQDVSLGFLMIDASE